MKLAAVINNNVYGMKSIKQMVINLMKDSKGGKERL